MKQRDIMEGKGMKQRYINQTAERIRRSWPGWPYYQPSPEEMERLLLLAIPELNSDNEAHPSEFTPEQWAEYQKELARDLLEGSSDIKKSEGLLELGRKRGLMTTDFKAKLAQIRRRLMGKDATQIELERYQRMYRTSQATNSLLRRRNAALRGRLDMLKRDRGGK